MAAPPADYAQCLKPDEQQRAAKFRFAQDQQRFVWARGWLRHTLARYLDQPPAALRFAYGAHGKPRLADAPWLQFNLSHAHECMVLAIARNIVVGVDVEYQGRTLNYLELAERFFTSAEIQRLRTTPTHLLAQHFFDLWTVKEAYLKATGEGLSQLAHIEVIDAPDYPQCQDTRATALFPCHARHLPVAQNYCAALVAGAVHPEMILLLAE